MLTIVASLLFVAHTGTSSAARCRSPAPSIAHAAARDTFVVLEATTDSVAVPFTFQPSEQEPFSRADALDRTVRRHTTVVYGQVYRVREAAGQERGIRRGARVVVIWWTIGTTCQRERPRAATNPRVRELFLLGRARPRTDWLGRTPLFDASARVMMFSPQRPRVLDDEAVPQATPMSMRTFLEFVRLLPPRERLFSTDSAAIVPLVRWADAVPERWSQYPARDVLCSALRTRDQFTARCPSPDTSMPARDSAGQNRQPPTAP